MLQKRKRAILASLLLTIALTGLFTWIARSDQTQISREQPIAPPDRPVWVVGPVGVREDIRPTLDRIDRGEPHPHRNDGAVFHNREKRLPIKAKGYYREFVHPPHNPAFKFTNPGPQRVVVGKLDEVFYTPDHYTTFQEVEDVD